MSKLKLEIITFLLTEIKLKLLPIVTMTLVNVTYFLTSCVGPKKQEVFQKINCNRAKLLNFVNPIPGNLPKNGHEFSNKEVQKIEVIKK